MLIENHERIDLIAPFEIERTLLEQKAFIDSIITAVVMIKKINSLIKQSLLVDENESGEPAVVEISFFDYLLPNKRVINTFWDARNNGCQ